MRNWLTKFGRLGDTGEIDDLTAAWNWVYIFLRDQRLLTGPPSGYDGPAPEPPADYYT
jgi:hypothetical protein